jgi:hypothetical protein
LENAGKTPEMIKETLVTAMYSFCESNAPADDFTIIIIKFKENKT